MSSVNATAEPVNPEATYNDLCEHDHNDEVNTFDIDHTADDERWANEQARDDDGWDAGDDEVIELGPDPEIDFAVLMGERWTIA